MKLLLVSYNTIFNTNLVSLYTHAHAGTHDLQDATINSNAFNMLCIQLHYINGSTTTHTHLQFVSSDNNSINFNIVRYGKLNTNDCNITLPANNWTLHACDESPCIVNPAAVITGIIINEVSHTPSQILASSVISSSCCETNFSDQSDYYINFHAVTSTIEDVYTSAIVYSEALSSTIALSSIVDNAVESYSEACSNSSGKYMWYELGY